MFLKDYIYSIIVKLDNSCSIHYFQFGLAIETDSGYSFKSITKIELLNHLKWLYSKGWVLNLI